MALPTMLTPGYTFYPAKYGPDVACVCLAQWLPVFRRLLKFKGLGDITVWQCTGDNQSSGNTHSQGGAVDWAGIDRQKAMLAREMGAGSTWPRDWTNNYHTHSGLFGCPHSDPYAYQVLAVMARRDGLGYRGLAGPDPLPAPSKWRNWQDGIKWAEAQMAATSPATPSEEDELMALTVLHPTTGKQVPVADALWSMWSYILQARTAPQDAADKVWQRTVSRDGQNIPAIQELADAKSAALTAVNTITDVKSALPGLSSDPEVKAVEAKVDALAAVLATLVAKVDALPKG